MDLQILTAEFQQELVNYRLHNIQNVAASGRQFLLKFAIPDSKKVLVLDCGNKVHLTEFERPPTQAPTNFVVKLRKHLKGKRLSKIKQIGTDRVLVLEFVDGMFYLVMEFFSAGNILLLDHDQRILSLQRMVEQKSGNDRYAVNEIYSMFSKDLFSDDIKSIHCNYSETDVTNWIKVHKQKLLESSKQGKKANVLSIHKLAFSGASHLSSDLILRSMHKVGVDGLASCISFQDDAEKIALIVLALKDAESEYRGLTAEKASVEGCILAKNNPNYCENETNKELEYTFEEVHPFEPFKEHLHLYKIIKIPGYNKALDTFFSTIESTKYALRIEQRKQKADTKLLNARNERERQIQSLVDQQDLNSAKGDALILHSDLVASCILEVQKLIDQQIDWTNIESYIKLQQARRNSNFTSIKLPLNLKENQITVMLPDGREVQEQSQSEEMRFQESSSDFVESFSDSDSDSDSESGSGSGSGSDSGSDVSPSQRNKLNSHKTSQVLKTPCFPVKINLLLSPYANAATYFDTKKSAVSKQAKVAKSTDMALKNATLKIQQELSKSLKQENESLKHMRPKYWFEKFFWFVTSEGYLCLAGRDVAQSDMIYYRHFNDNDYLVSSDIEGSLLVFVKNPFENKAVPPYTLIQAGLYANSASKAWNNKITAPAWFLEGVGISKKDQDGNLLELGMFNFKGRKEFLPPTQLVMGIAVYWLGDEEHAKKSTTIRHAREQEHGLKIILDNTKKELDDAINQVKADVVLSTNSVHAIEKRLENRQVPYIGDPSDASTLINNFDHQEKQSDESNILTPDINTNSNTLNKTMQPQNQGKVARVRGKKAKLKKIATKYAAQDEQERKLRMEALGTLKQVEELQRQRQEQITSSAKVDRQAEIRNHRSLAVIRRQRQDEREYNRYVANTLGEHDEAEAAETNYLEILDRFFPKYLGESKPLDAVVVFAPWPALNKFKYKVKITPGNSKKGKTITEAVNYFTTRKTEAPDVDLLSEYEILKTINPNDVVGCFTVGKVKLNLPADNSDTKRKMKGNGKKKL